MGPKYFQCLASPRVLGPGSGAVIRRGLWAFSREYLIVASLGRPGSSLTELEE
jgi:hypothetical protein